MTGLKKILVANRGEIALRVMRTCRQHGIRTVAVFSEGDRRALHVAGADEAVCVGPTPAVHSYLAIDRIIAAAKRTHADAIHPGYGFLSEKAEFAEACDRANVVLIGPSAEAMRTMGDKVTSRQAMVAAGVPIVPGRDDVPDIAAAVVAARDIGYPVMLKASGGGGGKGMRVVAGEGELTLAFEGATREAKAAFGDGRIFIERAITGARHVEIQLMADAYGNVTHLGERDCSIQRRHQKVVEECPSSSSQMNEQLRAAMGEVAVRAARAVSYRGAGTIEFLFEERPEGPAFYFLEMNTRLQVEHSVTEMTTGRDLVWDQIRVASGQPLDYRQDDVVLRGHAVECRVYAEDPVRFLPSPGTVARAVWPQGPHVRVDTAVRSGSEVSSHYDPMIAKITTWGPTRAIALQRMRGALEDTVVLGIQTNLALHHRIMCEPDFLAGRVTTHYLEQHPEVVVPGQVSDTISRAMAAAAAVARARSVSSGADRAAGDREPESSAWRRSLR